jgi:methylmalonyl-CoA mutase
MEDVVVGVNKYRLTNNYSGTSSSSGSSSSSSRGAGNEAVNVLTIDNTAVRESQLKGLREYKSNRDDKAVKAVLEKLSRAARMSVDGGGDVMGSSNKDHNLLKVKLIYLSSV